MADRVISRVLRKILDNSQIPSASIFVNLTRVTIWVTGAAMVLQPVFGINPTTLITALGVGGVAISLGLKDTIANIIGGFGLMLGRVIQPGDLVTIQGVTGTVHDITWRQTVVRTRSGDMMVIPNSVLNTAALTKLTPVSEGMATLEFTAKASGDPSAISQDILDRVTKATASRDEILKAIAKYEGAIVLVTHDEGAVQALNPERVLLMPDGDEDLWNDSYLDLVAEE